MAQQRATLEAIAQDPARNKGVPFVVQVEEGMATEVVPVVAATVDADLVVVGARGESALRRLLIGSTASRLLRKSACPVLLVKKPAKGPYLRALIPVDFSTGSEIAIRLMREIAPHAQIVLLHVFDVPFEGILQYAGVSTAQVRRYRAQARGRGLRDLHALARRAGLQRSDYVPVVEHGNAARGSPDVRAATRRQPCSAMPCWAPRTSSPRGSFTTLCSPPWGSPRALRTGTGTFTAARLAPLPSRHRSTVSQPVTAMAVPWGFWPSPWSR
jgi:CPA2 family monovalent cation:H+ antiporter-2